MPGKVRVEELDAETRGRLGIKKPAENSAVEPRVIALGKLLQDLAGLNNREALWALRTATRHIERHRSRVK